MIRNVTAAGRAPAAIDGPLDALLPQGVQALDDPLPSVEPGALTGNLTVDEPASLETLLQQPGWEERDSRALLLRRFFAMPRQNLTLEAMEALLRHLQLGPTDRLLPSASLETGSLEANLDAFMMPTLIDRLRALELHECACELYILHRDRMDDSGIWVAGRALCAAIREGSLPQIKAWVAAGAPLRGYQGLGGPYAAVLRKDDPEILNLLLDLGLPLEGSGEEEWVAFAGNAGPLRGPLLQAVTYCAWRCASVLLARGLRSDSIEENGLWFGSVLARYAVLRDVEIWMSRRDSSGDWLIPWAPTGAESWVCALLRRGGALGIDALEEEAETLTDRLHLLARLAERRGEDLSRTSCPIYEDAPLGVVARIANAPEEVRLARQIFGHGSQRATPGRLAMAIWCERILRARQLDLETAWMLETEVLRSWMPSCTHERRMLVNAEDCALCLAIDGDLEPVLELLEHEGLPLVSRQGPGLLRALMSWKLERAERWIEQFLQDPEWAAELLVRWSRWQVTSSQSRPLTSVASSPTTYHAPPWDSSARPFSTLRHSLRSASARSSDWQTPPGPAATPRDIWQATRCCVLALVRRAGRALDRWQDQTPLGLVVWRAFEAGRGELAGELLRSISPWACDAYGVSLWALWTCQASDEERAGLEQWRRQAPGAPVCARTGVCEEASLVSTLLQQRAVGVDCPHQLDALAWRQIHRARSADRAQIVEQLNTLRCPEGRSLLHLASFGPPTTLYVLLGMGLDAWGRDATGWALGFHALEKQRAGLLEACLRKSPPAQEHLQELLRSSAPCFTPIALAHLKKLGADLTTLDGKRQNLVGRMLRLGRLDSLRWLLQEGLSRNPEQTSSLQANPLCQMRLLSIEAVRVLLEMEPGWATTACPVHRCLPLQQAMLVDPARALLLLEREPSLTTGQPLRWVEQALRGRWSDQELADLLRLLNGPEPLDQSALEALLRDHRRHSLLAPIGEQAISPTAADLRPCSLLLHEGWHPIERVGRDWVVPFPANLVVLPTSFPAEEEWEQHQLRRTAQIAIAITPLATPHHPRFSTPEHWLRQTLVLPPDVCGESWLWERLQEQSMAWLVPWAQTPCGGIQEADCWTELLQGLGEQSPDWPLRLSTLRLARQLRSCQSLGSFLAMASALQMQRVCGRTLASAPLGHGQKVSMIQRWALAGLIPPQGPLELLHTPPVPEPDHMRLCATLRRKLGRQAIADELFQLFCDAPERVLQQILMGRGVRVPRTPRMFHQENVTYVVGLLTTIRNLLEQGGWPHQFLDDLRHALPIFWSRARRLDPELQAINMSAVMVGVYCSWVAHRPELSPVRDRTTQLGSHLLALARELEPVLTHWTGETFLRLLQLEIDDRQLLRRTVALVLTQAEDLHNLRIAALNEIGQLAIHEHRLYQGAADPWLLERLENHLPSGWEPPRSNAQAAAFEPIMDRRGPRD